MKAAYRRNVLLLCLALGMAMASTGFAWGPIAHFVAGSNPDLQPYQNLPDLWASRQGIAGWVYVGYEASEYFGWSHACQRTGILTQVGILKYPNTPTAYGQPTGIELPELDMGQICRNKLMPTNQNEWQYHTAQGFAGHNGADSVVHFDYFQGGSIENWVIEHYVKERWAEYIVFLDQGGTLGLTGGSVWSQTLSCQADPGIICLAQKVHRKNRQTVDKPGTVNPLETIAVESAADITTRITAMQNEHNSYVNGLSQAEFNALKLIANAPDRNWNEQHVTDYLHAAEIAAAIAMSGV